MTTICAPLNAIKTKGSQKSQANKFQRSTKHTSSYFEHVDRIHFVHNRSSSLKILKGKVMVTTNTNEIPMLDQFRFIASLLGMGEELWSLVVMDLFKEIS